MSFEANREHFNIIVDSYLNYVALYKLVNNGSVEGVTPFDQFYWRFTYYIRYSNPERIAAMGY